MKRRGRADHLLAWTKSPTWRAIASRRAKANLAEFAKRPRCGATCRSTGEPCRNPVIAGRTRCRLHGAATGRGDAWHKPVWPDRNSSNATAKLNRKLRDLQRAADKRAKRFARMTVEERASYDAWARDHQPTTAADRAQKRTLRRQNLDARRSIERLAYAPPNPTKEIEIELERLKAELEMSQQFRKGVFA